MKAPKILFIYPVLVLSFSLSLALGQDIQQNLERIYRANPGLVTQFNPDLFQAQAAQILDNPEDLNQIMDLLKNVPICCSKCLNAFRFFKKPEYLLCSIILT